MKPSEFIANGHLELYTIEGNPSANDKGAKFIPIKSGEHIPEIFINGFLIHNRNFIKNLEYKDGIPILTKEQEKKYKVTFRKPKPGKTEIKIKKEWTQEKLTIQMNELKSKRFKDWAEETFGEDEIDRRKSAKSIIVDILKLQEAKR